MSWQTIRERLKSNMLEIEGVYNVSTFMRNLKDQANFEKYMTVNRPNVATDLLAGWFISRYKREEEYQNLGTTSATATHFVKMEGFYGFNEESESELAFQDIIDRIADSMRSRYLLEDADGNPLSGIQQMRLIDVADITHSQFGKYLVHSCRINLEILERL